MNVASVETIIRALNEAGVRYLVAGGLATVAHGHVKFPMTEVDLFIEEPLDDMAGVFHRAVRKEIGPRRGGWRP